MASRESVSYEFVGQKFVELTRMSWKCMMSVYHYGSAKGFDVYRL